MTEPPPLELVLLLTSLMLAGGIRVYLRSYLAPRNSVSCFDITSGTGISKGSLLFYGVEYNFLGKSSLTLILTPLCLVVLTRRVLPSSSTLSSSEHTLRSLF